MSPREENIHKVVNLLFTLHRARKQAILKLSEEEKATITVTKEHLQDADITVHTYINTIQELADKGYLIGFNIFEQKYHDQLREFTTNEQLQCAVDTLKQQGIDELSPEQKQQLADHIATTLPPGLDLDKDAFFNTKITYEQIFNDAKTAIGEHQDDHVSTLLLLPYRDINELLKRLNRGERFDDIKDIGTWYDAENHKFYIDGEPIDTSYQGKPTAAHYVLQHLDDGLKYGFIGYDDIEDHTPEALRRAMYRLLDKNARLRRLFSIRSDSVKVHKDAF